jgi:hypothetical protein
LEEVYLSPFCPCCILTIVREESKVEQHVHRRIISLLLNASPNSSFEFGPQLAHAQLFPESQESREIKFWLGLLLLVYHFVQSLRLGHHLCQNMSR